MAFSETAIGGVAIEVMASTDATTTTTDIMTTSVDLSTPSTPKSQSYRRSRLEEAPLFLEFEDSDPDPDSDNESICSVSSTQSNFRTFPPQDNLEAISPATSTSSAFENFDNSAAPPELWLTFPQITSSTTKLDGTTTLGFESNTTANNEYGQCGAQPSKTSSPGIYTRRAKTNHPIMPISNPSCLQCHLSGLRCTFSTPRFRSRQDNASATSCSRCLRNEEGLCIVQDLNQDSEYQYRSANPSMSTSFFEARAEELTEAEMEKMRFALPVAPPGTRLGLRRVFRDEEDFDDWKMDFELVENLKDDEVKWAESHCVT